VGILHGSGDASAVLVRRAYHEAGHVIVASWFGMTLRRAVVSSEGDNAGALLLHESPRSANREIEGRWTASTVPMSVRARLEHRIMAVWAGPIATEKVSRHSLFDAQIDAGEEHDAEADRSAIVHLARPMTHTDDELAAYVEWLRSRTVALLDDRAVWLQVEALAGALIEHGPLNRDEIARVLHFAVRAIVEPKT